MGFYFDHPPHTPDPLFIPDNFFNQCNIPVDLESPGELSSPSLPPSPLRYAMTAQKLNLVAHARRSYTGDVEPTFGNTESKPAKVELECFERNPITRKWVCTKCGADFVGTSEARRHERAAAKCTGRKVRCLRCDKSIHPEPYSRNRHFKTEMCKKGGRKRGSPTYTVNNAFVEL